MSRSQRSSKRPFLLAVYLASLLLSSLEGCATTAAPLRCQPIGAERADEAGVDRSGHLWLWDERAATVRWLDPDGETVEVIEIPKSRFLDADREWGVVAIDTYGTVLRILRPGDAEPSLEVPLPDEVASVAWIDRVRVAVAPTRADPLVEVWNLSEPRAVRRLGPGHRIEIGPGATFLRVLALEPDPSGERLYTLDSLRGTLQVWSPDGELKVEEQLEAHRLPELERWRQAVDREARERGAVQTPLYRVLDLQVDDDGSAHVVERCSQDRLRVTWARVAPDGEVERTEQRLTLPVCSLDFARWHGEWVFLSKQEGEAPRAFRCTAVQEPDRKPAQKGESS